MSQSETHEVRTNSAPRVRVENDAGLIEAVAWDRDYVLVEAEKHAPDQEGLDILEVEVHGGPDEVLVTYSASDASPGWVDFKVSGPRGSSLDLHNASGEILISGFHGPSRAATASGTIRAAGMRGSATMTSASGAITGAALEGRVYARSASGEITLHGQLGGGHRLETASGGIEIDALGGSIDARSASGSIRAVGKFTGESRLRTVSGDILVTLLEGSDVGVMARGGSASVRERTGTGMLVLETTSGEIREDSPG